MGVRDARRLGQLEAALRGEITNREGAQRTGLSVRQFRRLRVRVRQLGPPGMLHGNRGRVSPRRIASAVRARIVALLEHPQARLNDCHIRDLVAEQGPGVSAETVRTIRRELGLAPKRWRRPARYHRRREREAQRGAMVQIDGSPYRWFGPDQPEYSLVGTLDDASGEPLSATFRPEEDLHGFTVALRDLITAHGVPPVLYGDRTGIAVRNDSHWSREEELAGRQHPTHYGAMLEELGIRYIGAHSPEAKGRIERSWQTFQDRLVAEFALHGITDPQAGERFLPGFFARYRGWFGQPPRARGTAFRPAPRHLDRILSCRYPRVVARDNTVSIPGRRVQLPPGPHRASWYRRQVEVRELLDGRLLVLHEGRVIAEEAAPPGPFHLRPRGSERERRETHALRASRIDDRPLPRVPSPPRTDRLGQLTNIRRPAKTHPWKRCTTPHLSPVTA